MTVIDMESDSDIKDDGKYIYIYGLFSICIMYSFNNILVDESISLEDVLGDEVDNDNDESKSLINYLRHAF